MNRFQYENEIRCLIQNDNNCSAHFEWDIKKQSHENFYTLTLNLITYNPKHLIHFLLHSIKHKINKPDVEDSDYVLLDTNKHEINKPKIEDSDYVLVLEEMYKYLLKCNDCLYKYMIKWRFKACDGHQSCSHFQGNSIKQIIDKIYYGKKDDMIIIDLIELIPDS